MIWHLALPEDWQHARTTGLYTASTRGMSIAEVGYLHAARDEAQARGVQSRFYTDVPHLVHLTMNESQLTDAGFEIRYEPGVPDDPHSELFPHVYGGPIPTHLMTPTPRHAP